MLGAIQIYMCKSCPDRFYHLSCISRLTFLLKKNYTTRWIAKISFVILYQNVSVSKNKRLSFCRKSNKKNQEKNINRLVGIHQNHHNKTNN